MKQSFKKMAVLAVALALAPVATGCSFIEKRETSTPGTQSAKSSNSSSPSVAEMDGTYKFTGEGHGTSTWTVSSCGKGCADIDVKTETAADNDTPEVPFSGQAHLEDDTWSMSLIRTDGYVCDDGTEVAVDAIYSWDAETLEGSWDGTLHDPGCGEPAGSGTGAPSSFTLEKSD
jgi:hypothetical protein